MSGDAAPPPPEPVCLNCRFGQGPDRACVLLERGDQDTLFAEGPCQLGEQIPEEAKRLVRRRYPFARRLEDDVASDALLRILEGGKLEPVPIPEAMAAAIGEFESES